MEEIAKRNQPIVSDNAKRIAEIVGRIEKQGIGKGDFVIISLTEGVESGKAFALGVVKSGGSNFLTGPYVSVQSGNSKFFSTHDYWYKLMKGKGIEKISPGDRIEVKLKGGRTLAGKFDGYEFTNPYDTKIYVRDDRGNRTAVLYSGRSENEIESIAKETAGARKKKV